LYFWQIERRSKWGVKSRNKEEPAVIENCGGMQVLINESSSVYILRLVVPLKAGLPSTDVIPLTNKLSSNLLNSNMNVSHQKVEMIQQTMIIRKQLASNSLPQKFIKYKF